MPHGPHGLVYHSHSAFWAPPSPFWARKKKKPFGSGATYFDLAHIIIYSTLYFLRFSSTSLDQRKKPSMGWLIEYHLKK